MSISTLPPIGATDDIDNVIFHRGRGTRPRSWHRRLRGPLVCRRVEGPYGVGHGESVIASAKHILDVLHHRTAAVTRRHREGRFSPPGVRGRVVDLVVRDDRGIRRAAHHIDLPSDHTRMANLSAVGIAAPLLQELCVTAGTCASPGSVWARSGTVVPAVKVKSVSMTSVRMVTPTFSFVALPVLFMDRLLEMSDITHASVSGVRVRL